MTQAQDVQHVQMLIERCLTLYMCRGDVVQALHSQAKIEPSFTGMVWQKLEEQNPEFFRAYHLRLKLKDQIVMFNYLVEQQSSMQQKLQSGWQQAVMERTTGVMPPLSFPSSNPSQQQQQHQHQQQQHNHMNSSQQQHDLLNSQDHQQHAQTNTNLDAPMLQSLRCLGGSTDALDQLGGMDDLMGNPFPSSNDLIDLARGHMGMGDEYEL